MIVAFRSIRHLLTWSKHLNNVSPASLLVYQVQTNNQSQDDQNTQNRHIFQKYGTVFTPGNNFYIVKVTDDIDTTVGLTLLESVYQSNILNIYDKIQDLWTVHHSWGPCFDLINAFLVSNSILTFHPYHTISSIDTFLDAFPYHYICDINDIESDFSLNGELWSISMYTLPPIETLSVESESEIVSGPIIGSSTDVVVQPLVEQHIILNPSSVEPAARDSQRSIEAIEHEEEEEDEDWEVVDMNDSFVDLSIETTPHTNTGDNTDTDTEQDRHSTQERLEDIDNMNVTNPNEVEEQHRIVTSVTSTNNNNNNNDNNNNMTKLSYKDIILKPSLTPSYNDLLEQQRQLAYQRQQALAIQRQGVGTWKPVFVVKKTPYIREDRVYGPQPDDYIDDENGCWDLVDAQSVLKYETALARKRTITMLPPKIQEKKDQRIIEKMTAK